MRCRALVNYGSERRIFPLPEEARRAELIIRRCINYETMTEDRSLSEICAHLRKTRLQAYKEKGKPISVCLARKSKLYVYTVLRETAVPRRCSRKQKQVTRDTVYPFPYSSRNRDSELSTGGI